MSSSQQPSTFLDYGIPLTNYKQSYPRSIFPDVSNNSKNSNLNNQNNENNLPQFLNENLIDQQRVIKYFKNDNQAYLKVFYFQYLKLCFEMEQTDYQLYISKIQDLLTNQNFIILFPSFKNGQLYSDFQFKRFLIQFMQILDDQEMTVELALAQYPIMNQVLIYFFRSLLIYNNKCQNLEQPLDRQQLFEFLASYFQVDIALYQNCLKFIDSDVFLYQQQDQQIFMIYIDYREKQSKKNLNQIDQYLVQGQSDGNISSVKQMVSNVNLSQINEDLEMSNNDQSSQRSKTERLNQMDQISDREMKDKQQENKIKNNDFCVKINSRKEVPLIKIEDQSHISRNEVQQEDASFSSPKNSPQKLTVELSNKNDEMSRSAISQNYQFIDFTYSKTSEQKILTSRQRQSFKLSMNSVSYGQNQSLTLNLLNNNKPSMISYGCGSAHSIKNKQGNINTNIDSNQNLLLSPILEIQDNFGSTLKPLNGDTKRGGSDLINNQKSSSLINSQHHQYSNSEQNPGNIQNRKISNDINKNQKQKQNDCSSDPQAFRSHLKSVIENNHPINTTQLDQFLDRVEKNMQDSTKNKSNMVSSINQSNNTIQRKTLYEGQLKTSQQLQDQKIFSKIESYPIGGTTIMKMKQKYEKNVPQIDSNCFSPQSSSNYKKINESTSGSLSASLNGPSSLFMNSGFNDIQIKKGTVQKFFDQKVQNRNSYLIQTNTFKEGLYKIDQKINIQDQYSINSNLNSKAQNFLKSNLVGNLKTTGVTGVSGSMKSPWKDITKQFTNSIILKQMNSINEQSIRMIKSRSRAHRTAISNSYFSLS